MGLGTRINDVPVKASRGPSGYSFLLQDVLEAAGVPEGMARKVTDMYRESGQAAQPGSSRLWFVGTGEIREYIARIREGLPEDAAAMTDGQREEAGAVGSLESCVAACERWAASRAIPGWKPAGNGPWGARCVMINGALVRAACFSGGTWFFEPSGLLRAAGIPEDAAGLVEACRRADHAAQCRLPGTSVFAWLVDLDGCGEYIALRREAVRSGLEEAIRRDGAEKALDGRYEAEDALCRLEECVALCRDWTASCGDPSDAGPSPYVDCPDADYPDVEYPDVDWSAFLYDPYVVTQAAGCPVPEPKAGSPWGSLIPKGVVGSGVAGTLLERLPMLCRTFGINTGLAREQQLVWIIWLMAFHGEPVGRPADVTGEAAFLWRDLDRRDIRDLVGAAMVY